MRLGDLKVQLSLTIPVGRPDKNGVFYSKEAIEKAVKAYEGNLPILFGDIEGEVVIGNTIGETCQVLWDDEYQVCEVVVNGSVYYGGANIAVNEVAKDGVVTGFSFEAIGLSR